MSQLRYSITDENVINLRFTAQRSDFEEFVDDGNDFEMNSDSGDLNEEQAFEPTSEQTSQKSISKRGKIHFIDARIVAALDRSKVSSPNGVHILTAVAAALGHRIQDLVINCRSIDRCREKYREEIARLIQDDFQESVIQFSI